MNKNEDLVARVTNTSGVDTNGPGYHPLTDPTRPNPYIEMVECYIAKEWRPYLVSFMFHPLAGGELAVQRQQARIIERAYTRFATRVVRRPAAPSQVGRLPVWICAPDFPVARHGKTALREVVINDGQHCHAVVLLPPWSRHVFDVTRHFEQRQHLYVRAGGLCRVHAVPVTDHVDEVVDYAGKAIRRRRVDPDALLILPRTLSEVRGGVASVGRNASIYGPPER